MNLFEDGHVCEDGHICEDGHRERSNLVPRVSILEINIFTREGGWEGRRVGKQHRFFIVVNFKTLSFKQCLIYI